MRRSLRAVSCLYGTNIFDTHLEYVDAQGWVENLFKRACTLLNYKHDSLFWKVFLGIFALLPGLSIMLAAVLGTFEGKPGASYGMFGLGALLALPTGIYIIWRHRIAIDESSLTIVKHSGLFGRNVATYHADDFSYVVVRMYQTHAGIGPSTFWKILLLGEGVSVHLITYSKEELANKESERVASALKLPTAAYSPRLGIVPCDKAEVLTV